MTATATSWKREPFIDGVPLSFRADFGSEELSRIEAGLIPKEMEDNGSSITKRLTSSFIVAGQVNRFTA